MPSTRMCKAKPKGAVSTVAVLVVWLAPVVVIPSVRVRKIY